MTYGTIISNDKITKAVFELTPEEHEKFLNGEVIKKITGCNKGEFVITLQMERKN